MQLNLHFDSVLFIFVTLCMPLTSTVLLQPSPGQHIKSETCDFAGSSNQPVFKTFQLDGCHSKGWSH